MNYKNILIFCSLFVISFVHATFEHPHKMAHHQALCEQYKALPQDQKIIWGSLIFGNLLASLFEQMLEQHVELFYKREKHQLLDELILKLKENYSTSNQFYKNIVFFSPDGVVDKDKFEQVIDRFISFYLQSRDQQILNSLKEVEEKFKELEQRGFAVVDVFDRNTNKRRAVEALHVFNVSKLLSNPRPCYFSSVTTEPLELTIEIPHMKKYNESSFMEKYNDLQMRIMYDYETYLTVAQYNLAQAINNIKPINRNVRRVAVLAFFAYLAANRL